MSRWIAHLRYHLEHAGWAGVLGLTLSVFALMFWVSGNREAQRELDLAQQRLRQAQRSVVGDARLLQSPRARLESFRARLPARAQLSGLVFRLADSARSANLALDKLETRESQPLGGGVSRQDYLLPLRGRYPELRAWMSAVGMELPGLVIEDVKLRRDDPQREQIEAQLRVTFYVREGA